MLIIIFPRTSLAFEDLSVGQLPIITEITRPVAGSARGMIFGHDALWATGYRSLLRVDPQDNSVEEIMLGGGNRFPRVAVGAGAIWVPDTEDGAIFKVDPDKRIVVGRIPVKMLRWQGRIAVDNNGVWVVTERNFEKVLTRFDPTSGEIIGEIALPTSSVNVAVAHGSVWVTTLQKGELLRIDPKTNTIVSTISVGKSTLDMATDEKSIWLHNAADGTVQQIDPITERVVSTIELGIKGKGEIVSGDTSVVVTIEVQAPIIQIDKQTKQVRRRYLGNWAKYLLNPALPELVIPVCWGDRVFPMRQLVRTVDFLASNTVLRGNISVTDSERRMSFAVSFAD